MASLDIPSERLRSHAPPTRARCSVRALDRALCFVDRSGPGAARSSGNNRGAAGWLADSIVLRSEGLRRTGVEDGVQYLRLAPDDGTKHGGRSAGGRQDL